MENENTRKRNLEMKNCVNQESSKRHSVGEQVVANYLDECGIKYLFDVSCGVKGIKNGLLRFDFVVPLEQDRDTFDDILEGKNNNYAVIEYNGIFHYHLIMGKTSKYTLCKQQFNDYLKSF